MRQGNHVTIGNHATIADDVQLGNYVTIGNNVTIYPNVIIEDGCRILDNAVIGRLTYRTKAVAREAPETYQPLYIGADSVIGCNVVLYTGVTMGQRTLLADGVSIREECVLHDDVLLGRYVTLNYNAVIGQRTRIMDYTHITGNAVVGEDCFISITVSTTNDNEVYLRRFGLHETTEDVKGPTIGHYVVMGAAVQVNPNVRIGDGAMIGTGALVTRDIPAWSLALGMPARVVKLIPAEWRTKIEQLAQDRGQVLEP